MSDLGLIQALQNNFRNGKPTKHTETNHLEIQLQSDGTYIQWKYVGFRKWNNLIAIKDLKGDKGDKGRDGKDGESGRTGIDGNNGLNGKDGLNGTDGKDGGKGEPGKSGADGKDGKPGKDGLDGEDGKNGKDGRQVELRKSATHVQWRYIGDPVWKDLILLSELRGKDGKPGKDGKDGKKGRDGFDGAPGRQGPPGYNGVDGKDGLTTSVNGVEQLDGKITLTTDDITDTATNRYTNDTDINRLADTSGENTGDQDISGIGKIIHFGTVETPAATAAKEVTIPDYVPSQGDILCIKYTLGTSAASPKLNINGTGAVPIRLGSTLASALTHTVGANGEIKYCYDGTEWQMFGSMRTSDSDTIYAVFHNANKVMGAELTRFKIIFESTDGKFYPLSVGNTTAITKVQSDKPYRIGGLILWYNTTPTIAAGSTTTNTYSEHSFSTINYTLNKLTGFTNYAPIYLIGSLDVNGDFVLDQTDTTSWFTQDLPSTEDDKLYLRLGFNYASTGTIHLEGTHPIYEYKNGKIQLYGASGGDNLPIVDTYADLEDLDPSIMKAIVKTDTLADRTYTTLDGSTQYEALYVNPLPPLYGETYEDTYFLSTGAGGTGTIQGQVEASEDDGFRLWTLQLSGIALGDVALAIQQNYIGGPFEITFNGKTNLRISGGWIDNLAYVDIATDEVLDVTMYDKKPDTISSFLTCYITPASDDAANWHRVKYALQPTPFEINYSGIWEKIDGDWTLVMKNDKLINGNTGLPLPT